MYKVIRVSGDYNLLIVENSEKKFYLYSAYRGDKDNVFEEASKNIVLQYFSGQADGMGFGEMPKKPFESLEAVWNWAAELRKVRIESDQDNENPYELMDALMNFLPLTEVQFQDKLARHGLIEKWPELQKRYEGKFKSPE